MDKPPTPKREILGEVLATLSKDPLSVQFLAPWFRSLLPRHTPLSESIPWMTFRAIRWLKSYLGKDMDVFEYGAGGSTLFFARRARTVVSVENDPQWHDIIARALRERGISNCDLRLVRAEPRSAPQGVAYGPTSYSSTTPDLADFSFEAYVRSIDSHPDRSFDLVSVDGHSRFSCVARAAPKVRPGGYLLLDNSDWQKYAGIMAYLAEFTRTDFDGAGPFQPTGWRTSVWRM